MVNQEQTGPELTQILQTLAISCLVIILPGIYWSMFGWTHMLLPLLSFYILSRFGEHTGKRFLVTAGILSGVVLLLLNHFDLIIFSAILMLGGGVLFSAAKKKNSPALSGLKACATLGLSWIVVIAAYSIISGGSPYADLLASIDSTINETIQYYRQSDEVSAESLVMVEQLLLQVQAVVPLVMPSILGGVIITLTWFTMVVGNNLLLRHHDKAPWLPYAMWQLPERLIWMGIIFGACVIIPIHLPRAVGINGLFLLSIVYCFQGLAVVVFYLNKWKVPVLLKAFFYVMLVLQSFGTVILLFLGVTDIWFDYRRIKRNKAITP
ncbi:DUF2232 domain-containing protein [Desulforhopalus singaporensis]|uniref:Uncharacterized conserved protein YybS, DUF2232 family n=1 Tax=Desulforhopalus singaporensis TaxID=91360 RepID=A0A1H0PFE6_9BACT|nr:Uncharacterized conserved protein YybS, DUF2232 family [Desulforhopalus singaporensis]